MDQNQSNEEPTVYFPDTPIYKQRWVKIVFFIALSPLLALAFLWIKDQSLFQPKTSSPQVATSSASLNTIKEEDLPIALDILQNPMVYEWRGSVEGILVSKDEKYIVLEKDNQKITILINLDSNGTKFFNIKGVPNKQKNSENFIELVDISIGTQLRGDFWVFPNRKNQLIGNVFEIVK